MGGKKRSAKRGKGKPDELNTPLHEVLKDEEEAISGEDTVSDAMPEEAAVSEMALNVTVVENEIPAEESPAEVTSAEPSAPEETVGTEESVENTEEVSATEKIRKFFSKDNVFNIVRYALMLVCLAVFVVNGIKLIKNLVDYKRGSDIYGSISDNIFDSNLGGDSAVKRLAKASVSPRLDDYYTSISDGASDSGDAADDQPYNQKIEQMKANLSYLKSINPDIYGYIHIDGTRISFPIVQGQDNEYYLNHAYNDEYVVVGAIFADFEVDRDIEKNPNTVIYGHNMRDGNMFNNVTLFYDEEVFNNTLIEIYTFDGLYTFKPFSIFETTQYHNYAQIDFETDEEFVAFCEHMQRCSVYDTGMTFTPEDRIITLSTCTTDPATYFTGRNALHAKLIKVEK